MYNSEHSSLRFGLYVRKSSEQEDRQEQSIESQITTLQRYAAQNNLTIVQTFEDSASAHKIHNRPGFKDMMHALSKNQINGIICWKADRLSRNPVEAGIIMERLRNQQIKLIATHQGWYKPQDAFMLYLHFGMADQYSVDLSMNIKRGNKTKTENGGFCHRAPCGYLNDKINKTIVKDPQRFKQVQKMFDLYLQENHSLKEICDIANKEWNFKTIQRKQIGGKPIAVNTLHRIFKNPFYSGTVVNGTTVAKGKHPPMISEDEFIKIQLLLQRYGSGRGKKATPTFAYTGLIKCGECNRSITAEVKVKYPCPSQKCNKQHSAKKPRPCSCGQEITLKHIEQGRWYTYYHCTKEMRRRNPTRCGQPSIRLSLLEQQIIQFIQSIQPLQIFVEWVLACLEQLKMQDMKNTLSHLKQQQKQLSNLDNRLENLVTMRSDQEISKEQFSTMQQKVLEQQRNLRVEIKKSQNKQWIEDVQKQLKHMTTSVESFKKLAPREKKHLLQKVASNFSLKDRILHIEPNDKVKVLLSFQEAIRVKNYCLELPLILTGSGKSDVLNEGTLVWSTKWEEIRTIFQQNM